MTEEVLRLGVDSRPAQQGAAAWGRSMDQIRASATAGAGSVGILEGALGRLGGIIGVLRGFIAGLLPALTLAAAITGTVNALKFADGLQTIADTLGITAQKYAELREAALRNDVSTQEFEMSMKRFASSLGDVERGEGALVKTANQYNIALVDGAHKALPFEQALRNVADRVAKAKSNTEALDIVTSAFGTRSAGMVNMLRQGAAGFDAIAKEAREAGLVLDQDYIARGAKLEEDLRRASTVVGNDLKKAFIDAAPLLIELVKLAGELAKHLVTAAKAFGLVAKTPFERMGEVQSSINRLSDDLAKPYDQRTPGPGGMSPLSTEEIQRQLKEFEQERSRLLQSVLRDDQGVYPGQFAPPTITGGRVPASKEGAKELEKIERNILELQQRQVFMRIEDTRERERALFINDALQRSQLLDITKLDPAKLDLRRRITEEAGKLYDTERRTKAIEEARQADPMKAYQERVRRIQELGEAGLSAAVQIKLLGEAYDEVLAKSDDAMSGAIRGLRNYGKEATNWAKTMEQAVTKAFSSMEEALVQFITTGKVDFKSLVDSILADIARLVIRQTITGPLANALSSALGSLTGTGTGTGGLEIAGTSARGNAFYGSTPIPFARGDIITKPIVFPMARGMGLAGEAGYEEAIVPLTRTRNGMLGVRSEGGGRGGELKVIINNYGDDKVEAQERESPTGRELEIMIGGAVAKDIQSRGPIARSFEQRYNFSRKAALRG